MSIGRIVKDLMGDNKVKGHLIARLTEALQTSGDWFHDTHRNVFGLELETCDHGQCTASRNALAAGKREA